MAPSSWCGRLSPATPCPFRDRLPAPWQARPQDDPERQAERGADVPAFGRLAAPGRTFDMHAWFELCAPSAASFLVDGGLIGTTIDWRSLEIILATGRELGLDLLNLIVWAKSNAGQGSLYRSQHELRPLFSA